MRYGKFLVVAVTIAFLTFGCTSGSPTTVQETSTSPAEEIAPTEEVAEASPVIESSPVGGYPAGSPPTSTPFDYTQDEGYPAPEFTPSFAELPEQLSIPTPQATSGVITGQLLTPGPGGEPYLTTLLLADTIPADREGYPPMIGFSEEDSPTAEQDKQGYFLFTDVPPGLYAMAIWSPITSTIIQVPNSTDYLLVEVNAGEATDLGIIGIP